MVILLAPCAVGDAGTGVGAASAAAVEPITTKSDVVRSENLVVFMAHSPTVRKHRCLVGGAEKNQALLATDTL